MFQQRLIKRSLVSGLVIAAASFPASAEAMFVNDGAGGAPSASIASGASVSSPRASAHAAFQWGDAAIGAAGAVVLLGAGAAGTRASRRRGRFVVS